MAADQEVGSGLGNACTNSGNGGEQMRSIEAQRLRDLLESTRVLALAVLVDGEPYVGLLPYVMSPEFSGAIVHASALARHTKGLVNGGMFSALIHRPDRPDADPLQVERITLQGTVETIERESNAYTAGQRRYVERFPTSAPTFALGDFNLYHLRFARGRYVGGFARARTVTADDFQQLA